MKSESLHPSDMFSGLFRGNVYIMLYFFWKIEVYSFQSWKSLIGKFKLRRTQVIRKWGICSLWKSYSPYIVHIFGKIIFQWISQLLSNKILSEKILMASFIKNDQKCWFWPFSFSQFLDINCHKIWFFIIEKFFDKSSSVWEYFVEKNLGQISLRQHFFEKYWNWERNNYFLRGSTDWIFDNFF